MGVVFGDIGSSPLYTLQVATKAASPGGTLAAPTAQVMEIGVEFEI